MQGSQLCNASVFPGHLASRPAIDKDKVMAAIQASSALDTSDAGIACYHLLCAQVVPGWGAALPPLALTFTLARLTRPAMPLVAAGA